MERPRKFFRITSHPHVPFFYMSKTCKKGVHVNDKKIYLETLKSVLGRSILHYWHWVLPVKIVKENRVLISYFVYNNFNNAQVGDTQTV